MDFDLTARLVEQAYVVLNEIIYETVPDKTISNYPARTDIDCDSEKHNKLRKDQCLNGTKENLKTSQMGMWKL